MPPKNCQYARSTTSSASSCDSAAITSDADRCGRRSPPFPMNQYMDYLKYAAVIAVALYVQFSMAEVEELWTLVADAVANGFWLQPIDDATVDDAGEEEGCALYRAKQAIVGLIAVPLLLLLMYSAGRSHNAGHENAVRMAEIEKRFTDYRFVYLVGLLRKPLLLTQPPPDNSQSAGDGGCCEPPPTSPPPPSQSDPCCPAAKPKTEC